MTRDNDRRRRLLTILLTILFAFALRCPPIADAQTTGSLTGQVLDDATSNPVAGLTVGVFTTQNAYVSSTPTDAEGKYTLSGLQLRDYKVIFSTYGFNYIEQWHNNKTTFAEADTVSLTSENPSHDLGATRLVTGAIIAGTVTDESSGKGIEGVTVQAFNANDNSIWVSDKTDSTGNYSIGGLRAGSYKVRFRAFGTDYATEWYNETSEESNAAILDLAAGETKSGIHAKLSAGGSISGKVTVGATATALSGAWIDVYDASSNVLKGYAKTGADGSYAVSGLPSAGTYKVQFFEKTVNNAGAGASKWYDGKSDAANANEVLVGRTDIDAVFSGASISGTVTKSGGGGIAGVIVKAYDSGGNLAASAETGAEGEYSVTGLLRGSYRLYFQAIGTNYVSEWYNDKTAMSVANAVSVTSLANVLTGKDAELAVGASISGSVKVQRNQNTDPVAVEGALVEVYDSTDSSVLRGIAKTGVEGTYEVTGLPSGCSFKVRFFLSVAADGSGIGPSEWYSSKPDFANADTVCSGDANIDSVLTPVSLAPVYKLLLLKPRQ